jgi:hypothetical protein
MEYFVYLKSHPNGQPWKWWAIAENDFAEVFVRFGAYNQEQKLTNHRKLDLKGRSAQSVMTSQADAKRNEGYVPYQDGRFVIDGDGLLKPIINNTQTGQLFNKPIVYASGSISKNVDLTPFSAPVFEAIFGDSLTIDHGKARVILNLALDDGETFQVILTNMQATNQYKVTAAMKSDHHPLAGMLLLYLNHLVNVGQFGSIDFADVNSNAIKFDKSYSNFDIRFFNHKELSDFRDKLEELGVLKQLFRFKSLGSLTAAVSF